MSQESRVQMQCTVCKSLNYDFEKSKQLRQKQRLHFMKFCNTCRKQTEHKETK